jgi:hypothetical protein
VVFTATDPPLARIHFAERDIVLRPFPLAPSAKGLVALGGSEVIFPGAASLDMLSMDGLTEVFGRQAEKIMMTFSWKAVGPLKPLKLTSNSSVHPRRHRRGIDGRRSSLRRGVS